MSIQPSKNNTDYDYFSNEIRLLIDQAKELARTELPSQYLTPELFFAETLTDTDCMLFKVLNGYITTVEIEDIFSEIYQYIKAEGLTIALRPNRQIPYSANLKVLFQQAKQEMEECGVEYLTTDIMLLALMKNDYPNNEFLHDAFAKRSVTYNVIKSLSQQIHETVKAITDISEKDFYIGFDPSIGESTDVITITGNLNDIEAKDLVDQIEKAFTKINGPTTEQNKKTNKKDKSNVSYCTNINEQAEKGKIEPIIGREKEINEILKIFCRKQCNNVVLVGESGVGKTAIVEGISNKIVNGEMPSDFLDTQIFLFNPIEIISGAQFKGVIEDRMSTMIKNLCSKKKPVLFIDNVHNILGDNQKNEFDLVPLLEPLFDKSEVNVIMATTVKGYHSVFEKDSSLSRKFQKVVIEKPTIEECINIMNQKKEIYENFHKVKYSNEAIEASVKLSNKYITERLLPSSAIDIIDEAGSIKKLSIKEPDNVRIKKNAIAALKKDKDKYIREDNISEAKNVEATIHGLKIEIAEEYDKIKSNTEVPTISVDDIYTAISEQTKIPISRISTTEKEGLAKISETLKKGIIGQDEAIDIVSSAIKRNKAGLTRHNRPMLSCMCIGSTGTGKTLLAKQLAKEIFGDEKYLVRFDMSEYSDKTAVNKLIGSSAGYVGYTEGGLLTEAIKHKKHAVLLIDEIEKATDEIFNIFLQVLDEGFLTDNTGQKVDFRNTIIILTSNVGAKRAANDKGMGFNIDENRNKRDIIEKELKNKFSPEFINRLDEIVYFNILSDDNLKSIIALELNKLSEVLNENGNSMEYNEKVVEYIFNRMKNEKEYGARPISRIIRKDIENKIADLIIESDIQKHNFTITIEDNQLQIV